MIQERILELTEYGLVTGLVEPEDRRFTINRLLELFHLNELDDEVAAAYAKRTPMTQESAEAALEGILNEMLDYAAEDGLMPEDTITYRDRYKDHEYACAETKRSDQKIPGTLSDQSKGSNRLFLQIKQRYKLHS